MSRRPLLPAYAFDIRSEANLADVVPLPAVLRRAQTSPAWERGVDALAGDLPLFVDPRLTALAKRDPVALTELLVTTPARLMGWFKLRWQTGDRVDARLARQLPDGAFDFDGPVAEIAVPELRPVEIAPGIWRGDEQGTLDRAALRDTIVLAEVLDRLSETDEDTGAAYAVTIAGRRANNLPAFCDTLLETGHRITTWVTHRVANFSELKVRTEAGFVDVPTPLWLRSGLTDADGAQAVVPAMHSALVVQVEGPHVSGVVEWFQGINGTGFQPRGIERTPAWIGGVERDRIEGAAAVRAIGWAGVLGNVIKVSAQEHGMPRGGYGITGVCNDTVAIVQHLMRQDGHGEGPSAYPLLMQDQTLMTELQRRIDDPRFAGPIYDTLRESIAAVPDDIEITGTTAERIARSFAWQDHEGTPTPERVPFRLALEGAAIVTGLLSAR